MQWKILNEVSQINEIKNSSTSKDVLLFKHSTSCSISAMAKLRLENDWDSNLDIDIYYLDLLRYRNISKMIAEEFQVHHESPQILLIRDKECIYDASHFDISVDELKESLDFHGNR